jgi:phage/plasmid-associated DNA primase
MANTEADLPRDVIKDTSIFKNLVAGDTMNAERVSASTISDFKNNNIHLFQQQEQEQEEEEQRHHNSISSSSREQD